MESCQKSVSKVANRRENNYGAIAQVFAWLKFFKLTVDIASDPTVDAVVTTKSGSKLNVTVLGENDSNGPGLNLKAADLNGTDDAYEAAINSILIAAGYNARKLEFRKEIEGEDRLTVDDNAERMGFKHTEMRRCPNHPDLMLWESEINGMVRSLVKQTDPRTLHRIGFQESDVLTYVYVWTNTFLGRYLRPYLPREDNVRLLKYNLKQRYSALVKKPDSIMSVKNWSIDAEDRGQTSSIALNGQVFTAGNNRATSHHGQSDGVPAGSGYSTMVEAVQQGQLFGNLRSDITEAEFASFRGLSSPEVDEDYIARNTEIDISSERARRSSAKSLLTAGLDTLSCAQLHEVLREHRLIDGFVDSDGVVHGIDKRRHDRKEIKFAKTYLCNHRASCTQCSAQSVEGD